MDERSHDMEKGDEVILPGFRFHPTDEELVSFYLKRKVQQRPLSIELIRQLDIYKYDPWDLPSKPSLRLRNICACVRVFVLLWAYPSGSFVLRPRRVGHDGGEGMVLLLPEGQEVQEQHEA